MDLLEERLEVNEVCKNLIRKAGKQYNFMALLFTLVSLTAFSIEIFTMAKYSFRAYDKWQFNFQLNVYPFLMIIYVGMSCLQIFFYYTGIKRQNLAIRENNQTAFEESFSYYAKGNAISICGMILYLLMTLTNYYGIITM